MLQEGTGSFADRGGRPSEGSQAGSKVGADAQGMIALSVIVPTFNEAQNIEEMVNRVDAVLGEIAWELIFVDDGSPDGTADVVRDLARRDRRIRVILRHNRRGLSSAVIEGALAASADVVAVMDGDLQHDEAVLPKLYRAVASGEADIASASRFIEEGGAAGLSSDTRHKISSTGIAMANRAFGLELTDPLTGFFAVRRSLVTENLSALSGQGFKVLLDLVTAPAQPARVKEFGFMFRPRLHGESKLDKRVMYDFALFFIEKKLHPIVPLPAQFISFCLINGVGVLVHLLTLVFMVGLLGTGFTIAQLFGTFFGMLFNYTVNNEITYSNQKLKGIRYYQGFFVFCVLCSVGVIANVGMANILHERYSELNILLPALAGALVTVVWNYGATRALVWGRQARRLSRRRAGQSRPASEGSVSPA